MMGFWLFDDVARDRGAACWHRHSDCLAGQSLKEIN